MDFCEKSIVQFDDVRFFVLDEADRMLDEGFKGTIEKLLKNPTMVKKGIRQTLMFSATFKENIQSLADEHLHDRVFLKIGMVGGACADVQQNFYEVGKLKKRDKLMEILDADDPRGTIVFVEMKKTADFLAVFVSESKHPTTSIHGDRLQAQREAALKDFKHGKMKILIATAVAARGLGKMILDSS